MMRTHDVGEDWRETLENGEFVIDELPVSLQLNHIAVCETHE